MDQLFVMQRYWGSDEEDNKEENSCKNSCNSSKTLETSVVSIEKRKSDAPIIDLDSDDCMVSNKKPKLDSSLCNYNKRSKADKQKSNSGYGSDIEIVNETNSSNLFKNINNKHILNGTSDVPVELKIKAVKKRKSKDEKLLKESKEAISVENSISNIAGDSDYSPKIQLEFIDDNKSSLKKKKKQSHRYFDLTENNDECDELIKMTNNTLQETFAINNEVKRKDKKSKLKEAISIENSISNITVDSDYSPKSQLEFIDDNKSSLKKEKKRSRRYFDLTENNDKCDQLNKIANNTLQETFTVNNEVKQKNQKSKLKKEEINNTDENTAKQNHNDEIDSGRGVRYFSFKEVSDTYISEEDSQPNKKLDNVITPKDEISENFSYETSGANNGNKSKKPKKSKLKSKEVDEIDSIDTKLEDNINSQNDENLGEAFQTIGQAYQQKDEIVKHTLPQWLSNPTYISVNLQEKETLISELNYLDLNTKNNLTKVGISFLFPVQLAVIPWLMQSKEQSLLIRPSDICVSAPTGSGKTLAFVLPIVQSLKDRVVCAIRALVVLPVSELAIQVYKVFQTYIQGTDLKVALLTGKKSFIDEQNFLVKSTGHSMQSLADIVVATPGRVHDHICRTQGFCLKRLRYLVIDEADRMMEEIQQGWLKQVEDAVFRDCTFPNCICSSYKRTFSEPTSAYNFGFISQPLQKLLYSATLTHDPELLHTLSLYKPKLFTASSVHSKNEYKGSCVIPPGIKMYQVICEEGIKPMVICHLIKHNKFKRVLCFTETVERAHRLHIVLEEMKILKVREISSFNKPTQRKIVLHQFCSGKIDILVCSDLVARGIDIQDIDCVISYDLPENDKIYTHRIGRTARAGKTGIAMTLLSDGEIPHFKKMLSANSEMKLPERIDINSDDLKPFVKAFQAALPVADAKLKKEKNKVPGKSMKKTKRKLK